MMPFGDRRAAPRRVLAAGLGMLATGCSFLSVNRARAPPALDDPRVPDTCTTSKQAPIVDTVFAGAALAAAFVAIGAYAEAEDAEGQGLWIVGLPFFGVGWGFAGSAGYGYAATAQCRRRVAIAERCAAGALSACQRLKPGWSPPPGPSPSLGPDPPRPATPSSGSPR